MTWKNWGDHPIVVGIGIVGVLTGLGYTVYEHHIKQEDTSRSVVAPPRSASPSSPSPPKEKPSEVIMPPQPSPSPQTTTKEKNGDLQEKLIGNWIYISSCKVNNEAVRLYQIISFNRDNTVTEIISLTTTATSSNFFSTRQRKIETKTQVTYEWSIEEPFLYMKIVDRVASIDAVSENGRSVKLDNSIIKQMTDSLGVHPTFAISKSA